MGYCIESNEIRFVIKKENANFVLKALKDFVKTKEKLMWVDIDTILDCETIEEAFEEIRYPLVENTNGDYKIDYFSGEKLGDDLEIFNSIAPYVEEDSYIEMSGEDDNLWRWVFKNGKCEEIYPTITW